MTSSELATRDDDQRGLANTQTWGSLPALADNPAAAIEQAKALATTLADTARAAGLVKQFWSKPDRDTGERTMHEHAAVQAWTLLARMTGHYVEPDGDPEPCEMPGRNGGIVAGFRARSRVVREADGVVVGRATGYCMRDEKRWQYAETYACASMAQTRSDSRALRRRLDFIFSLAGIEGGATSEEVEGSNVYDAEEVTEPSRSAAPAPEAGPKPSEVLAHAIGTVAEQRPDLGQETLQDWVTHLVQAYGAPTADDLLADQVQDLLGMLRRVYNADNPESLDVWLRERASSGDAAGTEGDGTGEAPAPAEAPEQAETAEAPEAAKPKPRRSRKKAENTQREPDDDPPAAPAIDGQAELGDEPANIDTPAGTEMDGDEPEGEAPGAARLAAVESLRGTLDDDDFEAVLVSNGIDIERIEDDLAELTNDGFDVVLANVMNAAAAADPND